MLKQSTMAQRSELLADIKEAVEGVRQMANRYWLFESMDDNEDRFRRLMIEAYKYSSGNHQASMRDGLCLMYEIWRLVNKANTFSAHVGEKRIIESTIAQGVMDIRLQIGKIL